MSTFTPPKQVAEMAKFGLEIRSLMIKSGMRACATPVGVKRAVQLSKRQDISLETLKRMKAFFDRHRKNRNSKPPNCGFVSWLLWGGDDGYKWCKKILKEN